MHSKVLEKFFIFCDSPKEFLLSKMKERQKRVPALTDAYIQSKLDRHDKETLPFINFYKADAEHKSWFRTVKSDKEGAEIMFAEFQKLATLPPPPFA